ncbi:3-hydroxyacyl-CoA dehydrogenase [Acinetobacter seifertii]|uniref:3-hydroxyacyl-CoA dehydrogenase n=1 Tax=Acinetobacter seifertii TaxID=1530123 RepID=UPI001580A8F8|nr:3-hydroxyacyl-CoA dehydrogenase [Acinetobacter seifertii]EHU1490052.1 3-hydroxyacyl-CoA dehydrogenase [Acinetobacter baumannii]MDC4409738.1 3-hydroxyacyl-CoA dehydrogenase [Acinetobacter baumannii]MDC5225716.1 3-hydroxyacyl-CoA dehydrogenase [Acinetobacter baumannii]NUF84548.1 3-hydroxyacyl-CoA dehydrogenase [Acinetobacter seifertii]
MTYDIKSMAVIGVGVMGSGIAQIAAQSGHTTYLYDAKAGAAEQAKEKLAATFQKLVDKNKITSEQAAAANNHLIVAHQIEDLKNCDLIVEAIVERLDIKQSLMQQLEDIVSDNTILASNTSSLSITAIAANCKKPERVVGYHFFNPVPLMKVVEVIRGLKTDPLIIDALNDLSRAFGHRPVVAKDTPGFIINHAGRAYGTEALKILNENVCDISEIDRILRDGVGFRMGPFELLDLTGLDVSHPVMESIYHQYYEEARYKPNPLTKQMLDAKQLGRKVNQGFYNYETGSKTGEQPAKFVERLAQYPKVWIAADFLDDKKQLEDYLTQQNITLDTNSEPQTDSLCLVACYGEDTTQAATRLGVNPEQAVAIDMLYGIAKHRTLMPSLITKPEYRQAAHSIFNLDGNMVSMINESIGFVAQRVLAMVINLGCDIAQQNIATVDDINAAVRLGLGYPFGPIEWGDQVGSEKILLILNRITALTHDPRYRPSPWLQRRVALHLPLTFTHES